MNANSKVVQSLRGLSHLMRPTYSAGLLLQDDDLTQAVNYTRDLSRLLFRTLFGCGVLCGLTVKEPVEACGQLKIVVNKGVALACTGDPIEIPAPQTITINLCTAEGNAAPLPDALWIVLCRYDKCCAPRNSSCTPDDTQPICVCTRERDGFEIRVLGKAPECACGCASIEPGAPPDNDCKCADPTRKCYEAHYAGECPCDCCCDCVLLAQLNKENEDGDGDWSVDHSVRRFVRPVLMRDPAIEADQAEAAEAAEDEEPADEEIQLEEVEKAVHARKKAAAAAKVKPKRAGKKRN